MPLVANGSPQVACWTAPLLLRLFHGGVGMRFAVFGGHVTTGDHAPEAATTALLRHDDGPCCRDIPAENQRLGRKAVGSNATVSHNKPLATNGLPQTSNGWLQVAVSATLLPDLIEAG